MRSRFTVSLVLIAAALALTGFALLTPGSAAQQVPSSPSWEGHDPPQQGCLLLRGWNVCDYGDAAIKDVYLRYQDYLGDPISGFDGRSQSFQFGRLTYNPANPADFRVQLDNLGLQDLQAQGRLPQPGAALHPAVRDWIVSLQEVGVDPLRLVGRAISPAICVAKTQTCMQYFDKQVFTFPATATRAADVQRRPLGELLSHPQLVTATSTQSSWPPRTMLLGVAGLLGLAGFGLFLRGRQSGLSPVGTI